MPFVKLDCGILDSTLWIDIEAREMFVTILLMAEPFELLQPAKQIHIRSFKTTGFTVPKGWYGFVPAAGVGIARRCGLDAEQGLSALERLSKPEQGSRTPDFEGRRIARIDGGFIVLNYDKYRQRDYTGAERAKRYRERKASHRDITSSHRDITQAEGEAESEVEGKAEEYTEAPLFEDTPARAGRNGNGKLSANSSYLSGFEEFWKTYPKKKSKGDAEKAWEKMKCAGLIKEIMAAVAKGIASKEWRKDHGQFIPYPATWLNRKGWLDEMTRHPGSAVYGEKIKVPIYDPMTDTVR